jgi:uncharacterized protein (TIGR03067 family)
MLPTILLTAALATGDAPAPPLDASVDDLIELMGTWEVVAATFDGKDVSGPYKGQHWIFAGDVLKRPDGSSRIAAGAIRLDQIQIDNGTVYHGVYRIDGDTLVWTRQQLAVMTFRRVRVPK